MPKEEADFLLLIEGAEFDCEVDGTLATLSAEGFSELVLRVVSSVLGVSVEEEAAFDEDPELETTLPVLDGGLLAILALEDGREAKMTGEEGLLESECIFRNANVGVGALEDVSVFPVALVLEETVGAEKFFGTETDLREGLGTYRGP